MDFGLFSNGQRRNRVAKYSYDCDLDEIVLADELGLKEAWISEHGTFVPFQAPDQLPNADLFISKAAALTRQIRLGPGIRPLPFFHPLQVATDAAVCDHLTGGRYMAGFGLGIGTGGGQRGALRAPQRAMLREAIELILKAWTSTEPFDWNGDVWQGKGWHIIPKPFTTPHMEVAIACSRTDSTLELAAEKGFNPLLSWTNPASQVGAMIATYLATVGAGRPAPDRRAVRVARFIHVSDSLAAAKRELMDADLEPILATGRLDGQIPPGGSRTDLTMEKLIDRGAFFCGSPDQVHAQIRAFHAEVGGFGTLLLVGGKDWSSAATQHRSLRLFMTEVAPGLATL